MPKAGDLAPPFTCGRLVNGEPCGAPATWHVLFDWDGENGLDCDEHLEISRLGGVDHHPYNEMCSIAGAVWPDGGGQCFVPDLG